MKQKYIDEIRSFNRFYTIIIGLVDRYILNSRFTLPEVRVFYEIFHNDGIIASEIVSLLHIDKGYLSRILKRFESCKYIIRTNSDNDRRSSHIRLTETGRREFEVLDRASSKQIAGILSQLSTKECVLIANNMKSIKTILENVRI